MNVSVRVGNRRLAQERPGFQVSLRGVLGLLALVTAVAVLYAYATVTALDLSYEVSRGLETQRELMETGRRLRVELNNLRSPERLEREALKRGLAPPAAERTRGLP